MSRAEARQLVTHGHFTVDGRKVNIPSFLVKPGMVIALKDSSTQPRQDQGQRRSERLPSSRRSGWTTTPTTWSPRSLAMPARDDIDLPVEEHLIVELYSK